MNETQIIVPHGQQCVEVTIDTFPAQLFTTHTPPGVGYSIESWRATSNGPIARVVMAVFAPR